MSTAKELDTHVKVRNQDRAAHFGTTNRLLKTAHWDIDVQKTGYITAAGRCLLMVTNVANSPFVVVLLNTASPYHRAADAIQIKNWIETGDVASRSQVAALNPYKASAKKKHKKKKHKKRR
jgi:D-alanyl-D-alanine endopeptidase (penicillin-binding protein 7)